MPAYICYTHVMYFACIRWSMFLLNYFVIYTADSSNVTAIGLALSVSITMVAVVTALCVICLTLKLCHYKKKFG